MRNRIAQFIFLSCCVLAASLQGFAQTSDDLFNGDVLHEIRIYIRSADYTTFHETNFICQQQDLDALAGRIISPLPRIECHFPIEFHWFFNGHDITGPQVGISSHGKGSRSNIKPSFKIEFSRYESQNTFLGLRDLILRADTQDASLMHERVAMAFLRKLGIPAPREAHARVFVNDQYAGVYTMAEDVDPVFVQRNFGESNGYLYAYEWVRPWAFEYLGPESSKYSPLPLKPENNLVNLDVEPIDAMIRAINDTPDAQFQATVSQYVDLKAFLTEIAAENFLAEQDGLVGNYQLNNFYLYRFANRNLHTFIPWDKSNTFFGMDWPIMRNTQQNVLSRRALDIPELLAVYRNTLARAVEVAGGPGGWLEQEITREYQQIRQAVYADTLKLCDPGATGALRPCSNDDFDAEVAYLIGFARRRAIDVRNELTGGVSQQDFSVPNPGGFTATATASSGALKIGYARIQGTGGSAPNGMALIDTRNGNMIVSETAIPASPLIQNGRIYTEVSGAVNTGLAIANPNDQAAIVSFFFTDNSGRDFGNGTVIVPANGQIARFLNDVPFNSGSIAGGTFTFTSSVSVAAVALRSLMNERSEFLLTTLPVAPTSGQSGVLVFPHFADGGGWTTQVILVNPGDQVLTGSVQFLSQGTDAAAGQPVVITSDDGNSASSFSYSIPAHSSFRLRTGANSAEVRVGSVQVTPSNNSGTPSGVNVLSFRTAGVTVTETSVPAVRANLAFRLYAETSGSIQTSIAVANSTASAAVVIFDLTQLDGSPSGLSSTITVPANGQIALSLNELPGLAALPASFQGVLRVSSSTPISVIGLRGLYNGRGDLLLATMPPVAEDEPSSATEMVFPHVLEGAGYTTQFILFSSKPGQPPSGTLRFLDQTGQPMLLSIR